MNEAINYVDYLKGIYHVRKEKNPNYSLRAFSRDLGISCGHLSQVFSNQSGLSLRMAEKVGKSLGLTGQELEYFTTSSVANSHKNSKKKEKAQEKLKEMSLEEYQQLSEDHFKTIADWHHFGILTAMQLDHYDGSIDFLSKELGLSFEAIYTAIKRMEKLGLVKNNHSSFYATNKNLQTSDGLASAALRESHRQSLTIAIDAIEKVNLDKRDFSSMMMAIDPAKIPLAKKMIREFRYKLSKTLESGKKEKTYVVNIQFHPLNIENIQQGSNHEIH